MRQTGPPCLAPCTAHPFGSARCLRVLVPALTLSVATLVGLDSLTPSVQPSPPRPRGKRLPASCEGTYGADSRARTGDLNLGKVAFYQLNYVRTADPRRGRQKTTFPNCERVVALSFEADAAYAAVHLVRCPGIEPGQPRHRFYRPLRVLSEIPPQKSSSTKNPDCFRGSGFFALQPDFGRLVCERPTWAAPRFSSNPTHIQTRASRPEWRMRGWTDCSDVHACRRTRLSSLASSA